MQAILNRVREGQSLTMQEMADAIDTILQGQSSEQEIADLLLGLRAKGETVEEVAGAAAAMRKHMTPIRTRQELVIDTCGTGGDGSGTFNISTAAALVTAAAGVPVAKHGNRSITSKTGSADVLAALGVNIEASVETVERCLDEVGIGFCFAPQLHPAMKHVGAVRRQLGVPTIFNVLGPLCNPASAPFQLLGVGRPELLDLMGQALLRLGVSRAVIVHGTDGLDEVTLAAATDVRQAEHGEVIRITWSPADFGLPTGDLKPLQVDGPEASATMIRNILDGQQGPARDIVVLNAAAALWTATQVSPKQCARDAAEAIDSGATKRLLADLAAVSHAK